MDGHRRRARWRPAFVLLGVVLLAAVFLVRLTDVQVVQADALRAESKDRRSITTVLPGPRGDIVDASGTVLATTVTRYRVTAVPWIAAKGGRVAADSARIAKALGVGADGIRAALTADPKASYALLAKQISYEALTRLQRLDLGWLYYEAVPKRTYPAGAVAGNLLGFVGSDQTPLAGVERGYNACLAGTDGEQVAESGLDGTPIPGSTAVVKAAKPGGRVQLTIDRDLQYYTQQVLAQRAEQTGAAWGAVVVEEVGTGRLLAVADWPTVDPNDVAKTADSDAAALGSRAFTAPYEPGSTMKAVTASMLLDAGVATPGTHVVAPYRLRTADGADINDSEQHGNERLTLTGVLVQSSNTGISQLGGRISDERRLAYLKAFGFGSPTAVGFAAEAGGSFGAGPDWDPQTHYATMFGQGLTVSAVQMASAYQTLANGGVRLPVRLVESCRKADGTVRRVDDGSPTRVISSSAARSTVSMLENVATKGWLAADVRIPGYRIGIKTGTAQEVDASGGYSKNYLVSMAGVAPADHPKYVVYVALSQPTKLNSSQATAPVWRKVMARALQTGGVVPSGTASPDLPASW
ncbi:peptidoglycan D,D-transpeptidase FtsI family protein [Amnibacterium kyonggiense]|uniref:Cell division protein FtsI (Penicillin-binding protein 3) n=1 Tax=Amnibacterium kyonggiense TaxID=595671 RepID=A0A4R7FKY6_9MICO|nr:penicillin-binding protein 2 [Amnibacterium kyonggiense]TDS77019.1 cell division protein FtsI (penicillin-binding protein 3) [Amnibacterium kyonggiense]